MTEERGSDATFRALRPNFMDVIEKRLFADYDRWALEQEKVEQQPLRDDPGVDHPEREPIT